MAWGRDRNKRERAARAPRAEVEAVALRLLTRRDHATEELRRKLRERGFRQELIEEVIERCVDWGYLDDGRVNVRWAQALAEKQWGELKIRVKLRERGLSDELVGEALATIEEAVYLEQAAARVARKFGDPVEMSQEERQKAWRHLAYRGYPASVARAVLFG